MKVLIYGAGKLGKAFAEVFAEYADSFNEVVIIDPEMTGIRPLPRKVRFKHDCVDESPDIVFITTSAVPVKVRHHLAEKLASIDDFWKLERKFNRHIMKALVPWLRDKDWSMLVVASNPVHEWVAAFHALWPRRAVVGLGTAFDNSRIKALTAAMYPGREMKVFRAVQVLGGHGTAFTICNDKVPRQIINVAKWMSNTISVAFVNAADEYSRIWWKTTAIIPLVRGLSGHRTQTHLITPVTYRGVHGVTGIDVVVEGLNIRALQPRRLSLSELRQYLRYLRRSTQVGMRLARQIT